MSVRPPPPDITGNEDTAQYTGEIVGLSFQDIPIRSVLQIMADYYDFSLVAGDAVTGNLTLVLDNVPWDQALELILRLADWVAVLKVMCCTWHRRGDRRSGSDGN